MEDLSSGSSSKKNKKSNSQSTRSSKRLKTSNSLSSESVDSTQQKSTRSKRSSTPEPEETELPITHSSKRRRKEKSSESSEEAPKQSPKSSHKHKSKKEEKMSEKKNTNLPKKKSPETSQPTNQNKSQKKPEKKVETPSKKAEEKEVKSPKVETPSKKEKPIDPSELEIPSFRGFGRDSFAPNPLSRSKLTNLLSGLKAEGEEALQLQSLMELSDFLSIGTEDSMASFSFDSFVPPLVNLLNMEHNPEIMLLACRSLTYMIEALPSAAGSLVSHGAIPALTAKLLNIEYIDVAEQAIQCLEKVSQEYFPNLLKEGTLGACLMFLDFFQIATQRSAVNLAANICRQVPTESFDKVVDSIPTLTQLLQHSDTKVMEKGVISFARLADSFYGFEDNLTALTKYGLLKQLVRLLSLHNTNSISSPTFTLVLRLLTTLCTCCPSLALPLLEENIPSVLQAVLAGTGNSESTSSSSSITTEQLYEMLSLTNELLPTLPKDINQFFIIGARPLTTQQINLARKAKKQFGSKKEEKEKEYSESEESESERVDEDESKTLVTPRETRPQKTNKNEDKDPRLKLLSDRPKLIISLSENLLSTLIQVFSSTVNLSVRYKILSVITKILHFSTSASLRDLLRNLSISSFTANLLASADLSTVAIALTMSEILVEKLPEIFRIFFRREGVVFEIDRLAKMEIRDTKKDATPPPPTQEGHMSSQELQKWIKEHSKKLKKSYFESKTEDDDSEQLRRLKSAVAQLNDNIKPGDASEKILSEISKILTSEDSVSTFEFLRSNLLDVLVIYLSQTEGSEHENENLVARVTNFCNVFFHPDISEKSEKHQQPLIVLVRKLHQSLNKLERFPVIINEIGGTAAGLKYLTQPFKLKLQKVGDDDRLIDYSENTIFVEPLATVNAIQEFLTTKVKVDPAKAKAESKSEVIKPEPKAEKETPKKPAKKAKETPKQTKERESSKPAIDPATKTSKSKSKRKKKRQEKQPKAEKQEESMEVENEEMLEDVLDEMEFEEEHGDDEIEEEIRTPEVYDVQLSSPDSSSALKQEEKKEPAKIQLFLNDEPLSPNFSIFQALQRAARKQELSSSEGGQPQPAHTLWEKIHTFTYSLTDSLRASGVNSNSVSVTNFVPPSESPYIDFIQTDRSSLIECSEQTKKVLILLRILHELNGTWASFIHVLDKKLSQKHIISPTEFINGKLTAKLMRQLQDPLTLCSGALPDWCKYLAYNYFFLFPFECRRLFFYCTSFGIARALQALQQHAMGNSTVSNNRAAEFRVGRIPRQKVRIARQRVLDSMYKVMELYGRSRAVLEVEYFGEVGTGLGPTLEFYTLVSRELQRKDLKLWRDEKPLKEGGKSEENTSTVSTSENTQLSDSVKFVFNAGGLYPQPIQPSVHVDETAKISKTFKLMGTFVAKAMLDSRILDLHLSTAFLKFLLNKPLNFDDLKHVDNDFGVSLEKLLNICKQKKAIERDQTLSREEQAKAIKNIKLDKGTIEDLGLDFTVPGRPNWELKPKGSSIDVTIDNVDEYLALVVKTHLITGTESQLQSFRQGFNEVFPIENLGVFATDELETFLCGVDQASWDMQTLLENTRCDHGYTHDSSTVKYLLEIMTEMKSSEQRQFLLFVTGSPKLPPGGFKSLDPKLTIVRKEADGKDPDCYLPSVNCCFYYLKLPEYSSKKVLKEKLLFAIENGQGSFSFN